MSDKVDVQRLRLASGMHLSDKPLLIVQAVGEIERLRARVAELEAAQEWRPIERGDAMKLVNALWGAGFKEGTLEHHPSPSNATLKKASDASQVTKDALIAALTAPPKVAT